MSDNLTVNQLPKYLIADEPHSETIEVTVDINDNLDLEDGAEFQLEDGEPLELEGKWDRDAFVLEINQAPKLLVADDLDD